MSQGLAVGWKSSCSIVPDQFLWHSPDREVAERQAKSNVREKMLLIQTCHPTAAPANPHANVHDDAIFALPARPNLPLLQAQIIGSIWNTQITFQGTARHEQAVTPWPKVTPDLLERCSSKTLCSSCLHLGVTAASCPSLRVPRPGRCAAALA